MKNIKVVFIGVSILLTGFPSICQGQIFKSDPLRVGVSINANIGLTGRRSTFFNLSGAISLLREIKQGDFHFTPGIQLSANMYSRGPGTSSIDAYNRKGQLDLLSSVFCIGAYNWQIDSPAKFIRLHNQQTTTSIYHNYDAALSYATSFLLNNSGRNQQIGHFGFNIDRLLFGYYNDGFWPFQRFAGDGFDRYWTGGGYLGLGLSFAAPKAPWADGQFLEYAYDRFTGNVQQGYILSKEMLFGAIPQKELAEAFLNRAMTSLVLRNVNGSKIGFGLMGHCPKCDIQDGLHRLLGYSRHVSLTRCQFVLLGGYQYNDAFQVLTNQPQ